LRQERGGNCRWVTSKRNLRLDKARSGSPRCCSVLTWSPTKGGRARGHALNQHPSSRRATRSHRNGVARERIQCAWLLTNVEDNGRDTVEVYHGNRRVLSTFCCSGVQILCYSMFRDEALDRLKFEIITVEKYGRSNWQRRRDSPIDVLHRSCSTEVSMTHSCTCNVWRRRRHYH